MLEIYVFDIFMVFVVEFLEGVRFVKGEVMWDFCYYGFW